MDRKEYPSDVMYDDQGRPYIFRMTITVKGRKIHRPNGRPFIIYLD